MEMVVGPIHALRETRSGVETSLGAVVGSSSGTWRSTALPGPWLRHVHHTSIGNRGKGVISFDDYS